MPLPARGSCQPRRARRSGMQRRRSRRADRWRSGAGRRCVTGTCVVRARSLALAFSPRQGSLALSPPVSPAPVVTPAVTSCPSIVSESVAASMTTTRSLVTVRRSRDVSSTDSRARTCPSGLATSISGDTGKGEAAAPTTSATAPTSDVAGCAAIRRRTAPILYYTRRPRRRRDADSGAEVRVDLHPGGVEARRPIDVLELRVVEDVVALEPELQPSCPAEREVLEER